MTKKKNEKLIRTQTKSDHMSKKTSVVVTIPPSGDLDLEALNEALQAYQRHSLATIKDEIGYDSLMPLLNANRQSEKNGNPNNHSDAFSDGEFDLKKAHLIEKIEKRLHSARTHPDFNELMEMVTDCISLGRVTEEHDRRKRHLSDVQRVAKAKHGLVHNNEQKRIYNRKRQADAKHWHGLVRTAIEERVIQGFWDKSRSMQADIVLRVLKKNGVQKSKGTIENFLRSLQK